ncbi:hypothetical protein JI76_37990 (plasmid) [Streptomyces anulatus]|uniref:hypothetical protein n=1 Tax=Streptomyces anulatus TaxID=1892 RepID=UPI0006DA69F7|nr:hypothetical protein [Streptomyces anulatus]KPL26278.1 hypothetical protein JI76_37990 [Streptomyces anulatus]
MGIFRRDNSTEINGGVYGGENYGISGGVHHGTKQVGGESADERRSRLDAEAAIVVNAMSAAIDEVNAKKNS